MTSTVRERVPRPRKGPGTGLHRYHGHVETSEKTPLLRDPKSEARSYLWHPHECMCGAEREVRSTIVSGKRFLSAVIGVGTVSGKCRGDSRTNGGLSRYMFQTKVSYYCAIYAYRTKCAINCTYATFIKGKTDDAEHVVRKYERSVSPIPSNCDLRSGSGLAKRCVLCFPRK